MHLRICFLGLLLASVSLPAHHARAGERPLFEPAATAPATRGELAIGDPFPDAELRDQGNHPVHLADFRGQAVAITFFYSRCPSPTFCPLVSRNFDQTQALLKKLGCAEHCHLVSLSLDPANDSPEVLAAYSKASGADPGLWTFASTPENEVRRLGAAVGLEFQRKGEQIDHNLRTAVLDPQGRLQHIFRGEKWTPAALAAELASASRRVADAFLQQVPASGARASAAPSFATAAPHGD